jgi:predicted thioesterase
VVELLFPFLAKCVGFHRLWAKDPDVGETVSNRTDTTEETEPVDFSDLVGRETSESTLVTEKNTASAVGSGGVHVFATPSMILLMEQAARNAVQDALPDGWTTVGTRVDVRHLAATPLGQKVVAKATVVDVDGRRLVFEVEASDQRGKVGEGKHERFIVDLERFMSKLEND